ncbi:JAB domain-containing protein [Pseudaeromonas pectinilytica]
MKNKKFLAGEETGTYIVPEQVTEADILDMALKLARGRLSKGRKIEQPSSAFSYLQTLMHEYEHEVFGVLFLDTKHRVIRFEELFKGTLDAASVYPREVTAYSHAWRSLNNIHADHVITSMPITQ